MHRFLIAASIIVFISSPAAAQTVTATTGAMNGTVTDSTKGCSRASPSPCRVRR